LAFLYDFEHSKNGQYVFSSVMEPFQVSVAAKSCCRSFAVTQGIFWSCPLRNLVAAVESCL